MWRWRVGGACLGLARDEVEARGGGFPLYEPTHQYVSARLLCPSFTLEPLDLRPWLLSGGLWGKPGEITIENQM